MHTYTSLSLSARLAELVSLVYFNDLRRVLGTSQLVRLGNQQRPTNSLRLVCLLFFSLSLSRVSDTKMDLDPGSRKIIRK